MVVVLPFKNDFQVFNPPPRSLECKNPNKSAISCHALERCTETSCGDPLQWEKDGGWGVAVFQKAEKQQRDKEEKQMQRDRRQESKTEKECSFPENKPTDN